MAEKQLLFRLTRKDFVIEAKRGSGKGGQNRNVTNSACRIRHPASGAEAQSQDQRDYKQNEKTAFLRLLETPKFKAWHRMEVARRMGILAEVDKTVAQQMQPENLRVEVKQNGRWALAPEKLEEETAEQPAGEPGPRPCLDPEKMNGYADQFGGSDY